jgi:hypothetical protein
MKIVASFPSVKKSRFNHSGEEQTITTEGDADWLNSTLTRAPFTTLVDSSSASSNVEPAYTQPSTLFPTYNEVVHLTGLLETKVMSVSSGKQQKYASKVNSASKINR